MQQNIQGEPILNIKVLTIAFITSVLYACGGGGGGGTPGVPATGSSTPTTATPADPSAGQLVVAMTDGQAKEMALKLWRDDDLGRHPKGSCAGCHGADFFDLARINSTETDIKRRSIIDGASEQEAQALVQAIKKLRGDASLPTVNARTFRPFQPGDRKSVV